MTGIFISYRREDSADVTGRINDRLAHRFGQDRIFTDVDSIPLGVNFGRYIDEQVGMCQIFLAVVGRDWLGVTDEQGQSRLQNPNDFVRIEIESALKRHIPVIPLLVRGATMPRATDLPETLEELALRNGALIRPNPDFHSDMDRLVKGIEKHLEQYAKAEAKRKAKEEQRERAAAEAQRKAKEERGERAAAEAERKVSEEQREKAVAEAKRKTESDERSRRLNQELMRLRSAAVDSDFSGLVALRPEVVALIKEFPNAPQPKQLLDELMTAFENKAQSDAATDDESISHTPPSSDGPTRYILYGLLFAFLMLFLLSIL